MSDWTESQIIDLISREFPSRDDITIRGIGDDCAILRDRFELITTDASIEGVHFNLEWMTLADAAYRSMTSNISDIAAMGAYAGPFTLALGLSPALPLHEIQAAVQAIKSCIQDHGLDKCWLIGGDVVRSRQTLFSITLLGQNPPWPAVLRTGARPGNAILVLGNPGFSAAGLEICRRGLHLTPEFQKFATFIQDFRRPKALTALGPAIARRQLATAMMDLSDGIRTDLPRLMMQSHCAAKIQIENLTPPPQLCEIAEKFDLDPIDWMLCGGEDFGLLMTCEPNHAMTIINLARENGISCFRIGSCMQGTGVQWLENGLPSLRSDESFSHFPSHSEAPS